MSLGIPPDVHQKLEETLGSKIKTFTRAGGGCINHGGKLTTGEGSFFLKWNDRSKYPNMFSAEKNGLTVLRDADAIKIPNVIDANEVGEHQYILLEYVEAAPKSIRYWEMLGEKLAMIHRVSTDAYGFEIDNYIGSLRQHNPRHNSWIDFFIEARLKPQIDLATKNGSLAATDRTRFDRLMNILPGLLTEERPSLLHGDLWSGNVIVDSDGYPCLIDPAAYYGNREIEIAFTTLFGGFSEKFYEAYRSVLPLENGFEDRFYLYNLYPLLVHVNLFGVGYLPQVVSILKRFV